MVTLDLNFLELMCSIFPKVGLCSLWFSEFIEYSKQSRCLVSPKEKNLKTSFANLSQLNLKEKNKIRYNYVPLKKWVIKSRPKSSTLPSICPSSPNAALKWEAFPGAAYPYFSIVSASTFLAESHFSPRK